MTNVINIKEVDSEPEYTREWFKQKRQEFYQKSLENDALLNAMLEECGLPKRETFHEYAERRGFLKDFL